MKNDLFKFYQKYYDLIDLGINLSNKKFLFLIYDSYYDYYLDNDHFIETDNIDNMLKEIKMFETKYSIEIRNFYPVCFSNNTLVIAIKLNKEDGYCLNRISYDIIPNKYAKLVEYHKDEYVDLYLSKRIKNEVQNSRKYIGRYKFYKNFIKKYLFTEKRRRCNEYKKILNDLIPNKNSIIDISCGDNSSIFDIAKKKNYQTIVGNDLCLSYLNIQDNNSNVIFTNDRIENNNIGNKRYDVSFCRNTLHHMDSILGISNLIDVLLRISNTIIIIEIENPKEKKGTPKMLNKYLYTKFLKDLGKCYINKKEFKSIIDDKTKNYNVEYHEFKNMLGTYMIAKITNRSESCK